MAETRAQANRKIRQQALRDQLAEQCRIQHVIENIIKIEELAESEEVNMNRINAIKIANEQRLKLVDKYLPNEKPVEISGDPDNPLKITKLELVALTADN